MGGDNFYLLSSLPALNRLGDTPPLTEAGLLEKVSGSPGPRRLIETLMLSDDLLQREAMLSGELEEVSPAVLSAAQARNDEPLPDYLTPQEQAEGESPRAATDALWDRYFRWAAEVANREGSRFLLDWVGYEVALRNALAGERARALGLEPGPYMVARDLADETVDLDEAISQFSSAENPLAAMKALDEARWAWLNENEPYYSFADDELAAYAAKLMLMYRWHRLSGDSDAPASRVRAGTADTDTGATP
ncbi:MAG: DUF2764 family protein [Phycisphaerae bacterium]